MEIFPVKTEGDLYVNILCVQKVITSANNFLSLHEKRGRSKFERSPLSSQKAVHV